MRLSLTQSVHCLLLLSLAAWASSSGNKGQVNESEAKTTELKFRFKDNEIDGEALIVTDALVLVCAQFRMGRPLFISLL